MAVELVRPDGDAFELSDPGWRLVLELARAHGWQPTSPPDNPAACRQVDQPGAAALADAVERGLAAMERGEGPHAIEPDDPSGEQVLPFMFSPRSSAHWRNFIAFCRRGGFTVTEAP